VSGGGPEKRWEIDQIRRTAYEDRIHRVQRSVQSPGHGPVGQEQDRLLHAWEEVAGKGTAPNPPGNAQFPGLNTVLMIAIEDESILGCLTTNIREANSEIVRPGDRIRMFQIPLDSIL